MKATVAKQPRSLNLTYTSILYLCMFVQLPIR